MPNKQTSKQKKKQFTVQPNSAKRKRGRPKGSKNKRTVLSAHVPNIKIIETVARVKRYILKSRIEKDVLDADQEYYFIYDLNKGVLYPEIIARFTVETEANLCVEFLNGIRKISKKEYNKKRIYIPKE